MKKFWPKNKILTTPKISVVTPVRDREGFIGKAIQSIIGQTFQNWEMIVINDHGRDNTAKVARSFSDKDKRIKVLDLIDGEGQIAARNFGVKKARGEIIVVADSDDINYPDRLKTIHDFFKKHPEIDIFYSNIDLFYLDEKRKETRWFQPYNAELLKQINFIPHPGSAYRRKIFNEIGGYDPTFVNSGDYDFWLSARERGMRFGYLEKSLAIMTRHSGSVRSNEERHKKFLELNRKKHKIKVNIETVKKLARLKVYNFFTSPEKYDLWFGGSENIKS